MGSQSFTMRPLAVSCWMEEISRSRITHPRTMIMKTATLVILVTILVVPLMTVKCAEHEMPQRVLGAAMGKNDMKYLACLIGCNASCPSTCFYTENAQNMEFMLGCIQKCDEHHGM